ncbi:hypothetical protein HY612_00125 [Candidatus Roizmanbacteria bacterium]|nr:hypothetical protein [Candidatus Roizmanbacteria bacterium]
MLKKIIISVILTSYFLLLTSNSIALELQSPRFKLDVENLDLDVKEDKLIVYTIQNLQGVQAFMQFKSKGYAITTNGSDKDMIFSLSQSIVNLGEISPGQSRQGELILSLSTANELDYFVTLIQEYPLKNFSGQTIPATSCDGGGIICSLSKASPWTSQSAYGFGYSLSGVNVDSDFINNTYFRSMPNQNNGDSPTVIMAKKGKSSDAEAKITFKLNPPPSQPAGTYETIIDFVAIPGY